MAGDAHSDDIFTWRNRQPSTNMVWPTGHSARHIQNPCEYSVEPGPSLAVGSETACSEPVASEDSARISVIQPSASTIVDHRTVYKRRSKRLKIIESVSANETSDVDLSATGRDVVMQSEDTASPSSRRHYQSLSCGCQSGCCEKKSLWFAKKGYGCFFKYRWTE